MKKLFAIFAFSLVLMTQGVGFADGNTFDQKFNELEKSMTFAQVKSLLGPPDLRELNGDTETWLYNENGGRQIVFNKNLVTEFGREQSSSPKPTVEPLAHAVDIGGACKEDQECKSQNCHFHTCSGKDNCSVPDGKICAINADCCSGLCDFGKCKKR